jgi:CheY-like chemotaxis protein
MQFLIVNDSAIEQRLQTGLVKVYGHTAVTADNGVSAIEAAMQHLPDIIICDICMHEMDGYEVARHLKGQACLATTTLVALTTMRSEEGRRRSLEAGFDLHCQRPLYTREFEAILAYHASRNGSGNCLPSMPSTNLYVPARRVLFVENDNDQSRPYVHALADGGFIVMHVRSANQALKAVANQPFEVVILDVQMPPGSELSMSDTAGGVRTGLALGRRSRQPLRTSTGEHPLTARGTGTAILRRTRAVPGFPNTHNLQNTNNWGATSLARQSQAEGRGVGTGTLRPRRGAGAAASAALGGRHRGLERPSHGWDRASQSEPIHQSRRHTKQPGVERVPAVKAPAPRSRCGKTTYTNSQHLPRPFPGGTAMGTGL